MSILRRAALAVLVALLGTRLASPLPAAQAAPAGHTYTVNSTLDEPDADASLGTCVSAPSGKCTLRAAIMAADFVAGPNTILLPAGTYTLTRPGYDDAALVGDLDIAHDLTLQGAGSGLTIVDGNGGVTGNRVFQILNTTQAVTMTGLTIRHGQALSGTVTVNGEGGGIYMEGAGHLLLNQVMLEDNQALTGGGLYATFSAQGGSLVVDHSSVRANRATEGGVGAGGGLFVQLSGGNDSASVRDSQVYSNTADGTGGGLYVAGVVPAVWSIARSQIYSNTAASGGGLGSFVALVLSDSRLYGNHAGFDGGALESYAPYSILRSQLQANSAGRFGGAIFDLPDDGALAGDFADITQSTLSGNYAQYGGAIDHDGFIVGGARLTLTNSTLSGNGVFRLNSGTGSADGGGLYVYSGTVQLFNTTIANNHIDLGSGIHSHAGLGGGVYLTATSVLTADNSLIANNTSGHTFQVSTEDDCFSSGTTGELAFDLIRTMTNCSVTGPQSVISGQDPLLGPLQDNGGSTPTQALLFGSPALDAGPLAGCTGSGNAPITVDQRGARRNFGRCDLGAYELVQQADMAVSQRAQPDPVRLGAPLTYTLVLTNPPSSPAAATGIVLTDTLPAGVIFGAASTPQGSCGGTAIVVCSLGSLLSGASLSVTLAVTPTAAGLITNTVTVSASPFDPALANNTASETTDVVRQLFLPLVKGAAGL